LGGQVADDVGESLWKELGLSVIETKKPSSSGPKTATGQPILVCDDNAANRKLLAAVFRSEGFEVIATEDGEAAIAQVAATPPAAVLLDVRMPGLGGLETLRQIKASSPDTPVIMLTAHAEVAAAVSATKLGAYDFLIRPINNDELVLTVRHAIEHAHLTSEVRQLRHQLSAGGAMTRLNAKSAASQRVVKQIQQVAGSLLTVLIQGETGTGKEIVARAIHQQSARADKPFIAVDCGAIPETLLESELFGHEKGAFSGADRRREGRFQIAHTGSLFLDEVGNLPPALQAKLLRVLQERQIHPLGNSHPVPVDVRFIAATNESLETQIERGRFRQDLYYRLAEFTIVLPPLRERREDILLIARRLQEEASIEMRRAANGISEEAAHLLEQHDWPGNVREVRNVIRQAVLQAPGPIIEAEHVRPLLTKRAHTPAEVASITVPLGRSLKEIAVAASAAAERQAIIEALRLSRWNKSRAAKLLKTDYKTLHVKMKNFGLQRGEPGAV
jgi:DNA-binding NtrC family response regulator